VEDRYVYHRIPNILIQTDTGSENLASIWRARPVLLTMVFAQCGGVCSPFLRSLKSAVSEAGGLGTDYRVVVLSFDPRDQVADMKMIADELGVAANANWIFGVASPTDIEQLATAIGFWFSWDQVRQQYDHPSVVVAIDRGRLIRMLAGTTVPSASLYATVQEFRGKFVDSYALAGKVAFRCFEYDPDSGRYRFDWGLVLMLLPATAALLATSWVFLFRTPSRETRNSIQHPDKIWSGPTI
jgi:cytochrome oxidase Cu insertion factor (SCO1/SenC/PrrC family)